MDPFLTASLTPSRRTPSIKALRAADFLHTARSHERAGCVVEAMASYQGAIDEANRSGEWAIQSEALRRLSVLHHHRSEQEAAQVTCDLSFEIAVHNGDNLLAAEALNVRAQTCNQTKERRANQSIKEQVRKDQTKEE